MLLLHCNHQKLTIFSLGSKSLQVTFFFLCRFSKFFLFSILLSKSLNTFKSLIFQVHRPFLIHILDFKHPQSPLFTLKIKVPQTAFPSNLHIDIVNLQVKKVFHISSSQTILNSFLSFLLFQVHRQFLDYIIIHSDLKSFQKI